MKKALLYAPYDVRVEEVPDPEPGPGEVRIRVVVAGPYRTDLKFYRGINIPESYPSGFGGESAGIIDKVGPGVTKLRVGQRVTPIYLPFCGECKFCRQGRTNLCLNIPNPNSLREKSACFQEYLIATQQRALPLPDNIAFEDAAMIAGLITGLNVREKLKYRTGESVLIIGGGAMGLAHVQLAKLEGCKVVVLENRALRRELAMKFGADAVIDPKASDVAAALREVLGGGPDYSGPDHVIETAGSESSTRDCVELAGMGGKVAIMGSGRYPVSAYTIMRKELVVYGITGLTQWQREESLRLIASGQIDLKPTITHRFSLAQIAEAFSFLDKGTEDQGRIVVDVSPTARS